jgi:DNA transposition AAA+ family ATPase
MSGNMVKVNEEIRHELAAFQENHVLTLKQLGAKVGKSEAFMSRYLSGNAEGDIEAFERAASDMLKSAMRKRTWEEVYFDTEAVKTCFLVFDLIREASDIGLVHGPAGIGKTTACRKYAEDNKTVISFTGQEGNGMAYGVINGICASIDMRRFNPRQHKRADFLRDKLSGSERLIIIDNAQRLNMSGLRWLFDFHDATGVSVALVGNPEVLDRLRGNDQMTSRIGFKQDIAEMLGRGSWLDRAADRMVAAMWPKASQEIGLLARETARKQGHLRTLNKQLRIAIRLCETDAYAAKAAKAFVEARHLIGADNTEE